MYIIITIHKMRSYCNHVCGSPQRKDNKNDICKRYKTDKCIDTYLLKYKINMQSHFYLDNIIMRAKISFFSLELRGCYTDTCCLRLISA